MAIRDGAMSGGTHLRLEERERLAALRAEGLSLRAIAARLGRAASTLSRELRRNALPRGGSLPVRAEGWTASRGVEGWDQNITRPRACRSLPCRPAPRPGCGNPR